MHNTEYCSVCKGTGREEYKYIRYDGETIIEHITCELCEGTGRIKRFHEDDRYEPKPTFGWRFDKIEFDGEDY